MTVRAAALLLAVAACTEQRTIGQDIDAAPPDATEADALMAKQNVNGLVLYALRTQTVQSWQGEVGVALTSGTLTLYVDAAGNPVAGVRAPDPAFCFRGDRLTLTPQNTTDATGLCLQTPSDAPAGTFFFTQRMQ